MKKMALLLAGMVTCCALSACVIVPARPVAYYPAPAYVVGGGGYHYYR